MATATIATKTTTITTAIITTTSTVNTTNNSTSDNHDDNIANLRSKLSQLISYSQKLNKNDVKYNDIILDIQCYQQQIR